MEGNSFLILDVIMFLCIIVALVNPSAWIKEPEKKNDPKELARTRKFAVVFLIIEIGFCIYTYL